MNMIQAQEALKIASDEALQREMLNPSGLAPQFLVLAELKRRKDMRAAAPKQAPQGTVADQVMEPEMMAGGGLVEMRRFQAGGDVTPFRRDLGRLGDWFSGLGVDGSRAMQFNRVRDRFGAASSPLSYFGTPISERDTAAGFRDFLEANRERFISGELSIDDFQRDPASFVASNTRLRRIDPNEASVPQDVSPVPREAQAAAPVDEGLIGPPAPPRPASAPRGAAPRAGGIAGIARPAPRQPEAAEIAQAAQAAPSGDRFAELRKRLDEGEDPEKARREMGGLALLEAGLRVAGSQSPNAIAALSEAAPSIQGYLDQRNQMRRSGKEDIAARVALENAATTDQYRRDMIATQNRQLDMQREISAENRAAQLEAARIGASAANRTPAEIQFADYVENMRTNRPDAYEALMVRLGRDGASIERNVLNDYRQGVSQLIKEEVDALKTAITPDEQKGIRDRFSAQRDELSNLYARRYPNLFQQERTAQSGGGALVTGPDGRLIYQPR